MFNKNFEEDYNKKLNQALKEENYDKISMLFFDLKILRNYAKKSSKFY